MDNCGFVGGLVVGNGRKGGLHRSRQGVLSSSSKSMVVRMAAMDGSRGVVVTGGTKGIGFALAKKFASMGHRVVICGRDEQRLKSAVEAIDGEVFGIASDVSDPQSVEKLASFAQESLGRIDFWINNAGTTSYVRRNIVDIDPLKLKETVDTNLLGSLLCSRQAILTMEAQNPAGGHIFNMEGAGSFGDATAGYSAYGATKRALPQLNGTLVKETKGTPVGCHLLSPGMVLTDLLLSDSTPEFKQFFNLIAEEPETVAQELAPKILQVNGTGKAIRFLTVPNALLKIVTGVLFRRNRFFDSKGERIAQADTQYDDLGVKRPF